MNTFLRIAFYLLIAITALELFMIVLAFTDMILNELFFIRVFLHLLAIDVMFFVIGFFISIKAKS